MIQTVIANWHATTISKVITTAQNDKTKLAWLCIGDGETV